MSSVTEELKGVRRPRFYLYALIFAAAVLFAGFARTYFLKALFGTPALYPLLHLHGIVMTSWFALFAVQTWLVSAHRTDLHRRLGIFGVLLTSIILVVGAAVVTINAREGRVPDAASVPVVIALSYANLLVFGALVAAAVYFRGRSEYHKRLMLLATLNLLSAAINRIPLDFIAAEAVFSAYRAARPVHCNLCGHRYPATPTPASGVCVGRHCEHGMAVVGHHGGWVVRLG